MDTLSKIVWVDLAVVLAIHDQQIAEHGGSTGLRDRGLLESALARPKHLAAYEEVDIASLATSYASGIAHNHPFVDGNKRTAFTVMELFLSLNGCELQANDEACVIMMLRLASSEVSDEAFAAWLRALI